MTRLLLGGLLAALASGCAFNAAAMRPQALGAGKFEASLEPSVFGAAGAGETACCIPAYNSTFRWGVNDRTDLGFRLGTGGLRIVSKFQLTEGDTIVAIAPELGGFALSGADFGITLLGLELPVLIGFAMGERDQFILGPGLKVFYVSASEESTGAGGALLVAPQLSAGISAWMSDSVGLLPSVNLFVPVLGAATAGAAGEDSVSGVGTGVGGVGVGVQLGILFGSKDRG